MDTLSIMEALASDRRLQILNWLRDPRAHFPVQRDGDLVEDGVCVGFIAEKLSVAQPTATSHLQILKRAGLLTSKRLGQWTFYKRDEHAIALAREQLQQVLGPGVVGSIGSQSRTKRKTRSKAKAVA